VSCAQLDIPLGTNGDHLTVRELVRLLQLRRLSGGLHLLLKVEGNVTELLLDVTDDFLLGSGGEGVSSLHQTLDEVLGQVTTGQVETQDGVGQRETLVDGDSVGNTITRVQDDTGGSTGSVKGKDGLDGDVERGGVEGLEHDLGHLFTVLLGVEGSLGQKDGVLLGSNSELVVKGVVPDLLHVVPVGNDTVLDGVLQGKDSSLGLSLITACQRRLASRSYSEPMTPTPRPTQRKSPFVPYRP